MLFYPVTPPDVTLFRAEGAALSLAGQAGMVAVRIADLAWPAGPGPGSDGRSALVAAGAGRIRSGDVVVFLKPVAVAPAVVRRDGRVQAGGHLADHARLGVAEDRLDALAGQADVIGQIASGVTLAGKVKGAARRAMTPALAIRLCLLMTLLPGADYAEVMAALLGDLALVPWQRPYALPTATVLCTWREAVGPGPLEKLRDLVLAGVDAEHRDHDYRAVTVGDLDACSIDGSLTRVPDTPANRRALGSAGTADDSAPYPQQRDLWLSHASTRATLAVTSGPSGAAGGRNKGEAEQRLLDKALENYPQLFTSGRMWILDRNFPGAPRIQRMLATGTRVLIRVKDGITLHRTGDFLPDGSYLAIISGGGITLTVRVIEYHVSVAGRDAPEMFCLITDLDDHRAYPAGVLAAAYHWRWIGSETSLKEAKSAISGAGPSTGAMLRSQSPALITQEHAAWVTAVELARATARAAAAAAVPARRGQARRPARPPPRDIVHRCPPRDHHHHPGRDGHRQPARPGDHRQPRRSPGPPGPPPRRCRPPPAPRPQDQGPAGLPARRPAHSRPDCSGADQHLPADRRLTPPRYFLSPCRTRGLSPCARRPVEPAASRSDSRTAATPAYSSHSPFSTRRPHRTTRHRLRAPDHAEVHGIGRAGLPGVRRKALHECRAHSLADRPVAATAGRLRTRTRTARVPYTCRREARSRSR
ncbi:MAG: hypothetical protein ACRDPO_31530 [Streptosporangiaceae bacterium]